MLSQDKISAFRLATAANNIGGYEEDATIEDAYCSEEQVVQTRDTVADFIENWGEPHETEEYSNGKLLIWNNLQTRKGARRGNLYVMDFGEARAAYFSGEVQAPLHRTSFNRTLAAPEVAEGLSSTTFPRR